MQAHLVQFDIQWQSPDANFARVNDLLSRAKINAGDLVVLPELFDSGFSLNTNITSDRDLRTLTFLSETAQNYGVIVQGGRTVKLESNAYAHNVMSVVGPDGLTRCEYTKIHPFSFGRESESFVGGDEVVTFTWGQNDPIVCCPAICYDLRFPELFRIGASRGAELFAVGANWPDARQDHWRTLLIARAIENQAFVLGVNRTGDDPHLSYAGGSIIVGPKGEILAEAKSEECVLSAPIEARVVRDWRNTFPALRDAKLIPRD